MPNNQEPLNLRFDTCEPVSKYIVEFPQAMPFIQINKKGKGKEVNDVCSHLGDNLSQLVGKTLENILYLNRRGDIGSVHIEISDSYSQEESDLIQRAKRLYDEVRR